MNTMILKTVPLRGPATVVAASLLLLGRNQGAIDSTELTVAELCNSNATYDQEHVTITDGTLSLLPRRHSAELGWAIFTLTDGQNVARISIGEQRESELNRIAVLPNGFSLEDLLITANDGTELVFGDSARVTGEAQMTKSDGTARCGIFLDRSEELSDTHIIEPLPRSEDAETRAGGGSHSDGWNNRPEQVVIPDLSDVTDFEVPDDLPSYEEPAADE